MGAEATSISVGSKAWAAQLRKRAKEVAKILDDGYFEMARILWSVYDTPIDGDYNNKGLFTLWGYADFGEYAQGELEMDKRKAQKFRRIGRCLEHDLSGCDKKTLNRLVKIGWSKMYELTRLFQHKNDPAYVEKWVTRAEEMSYPALMVSVMTALQKMEQHNGQTVEEPPKKKKPIHDNNDVEDDEPASEPKTKKAKMKEEDELPEPERTKTMSFLLVDEQIDTVNDAMDRALELAKDKGVDMMSRSARFALICLDFLMNNDFKKAHDPEMRKRYLHKLEAALGIKLVGIDENGEVFYGLRSLKKLSD